MRLHWSIFLFCGLILSGGSWFAKNNAKQAIPDEPLIFFLYIGYLFIVIAAFKGITSIILTGDKKILRPQEAGEKEHRTLAKHENYTLCPLCRTANHTSNRFCRMCGYQLRGDNGISRN